METQISTSDPNSLLPSTTNTTNLVSNHASGQNRVENNILYLISMINSVISVDIANSTKSQTLQLVSYDAKRIVEWKASLDSFLTQLQDTPNHDSKILEQGDKTIFETLKWQFTLDSLQKTDCAMHLFKNAEQCLKLKLNDKVVSDFNLISRFIIQKDKFNYTFPSIYLGEDIYLKDLLIPL